MNSIKIERHFSAAPQKVWQAWTNPQIVKLWFGSDPNGTVSHAVLDVRIGGSFEVTFANSDGTQYTCFGNYKEAELYKKLAFTWLWRDRPTDELITIRFQEEEDGTLMTFEQANIDENTSHNYEIGWRSTFEKIEKALTI